MSWNTPKTWSTNEVLSTILLNQQIMENGEHLFRRPRAVFASRSDLANQTMTTSPQPVTAAPVLELITYTGNVELIVNAHFTANSGNIIYMDILRDNKYWVSSNKLAISLAPLLVHAFDYTTSTGRAIGLRHIDRNVGTGLHSYKLYAWSNSSAPVLLLTGAFFSFEAIET